MESSTDSEESEDELDDDYDIGIDDIGIDLSENDDIHTATEDEESNILLNSMESKELESANYHKKKLMETLSKPKEKSPFTDMIEKGLNNYLSNVGPHNNQIKIPNKINMETLKKGINKLQNKANVYDYVTGDQVKNKDRPTSKQKYDRRIDRTNEIEHVNSGFDSKDSIEFSPSERAKHLRKKKVADKMSDLRKDQSNPDFMHNFNLNN